MVNLIAEAGATHAGNRDAALSLFWDAETAGADAVKFIASNPATLIADRSLQYEGKSLYETIKGYQFKSDDDWRWLARECHPEDGVEFFVSVGTPDYVDLMCEIGVSCLKLSTWDSRNFPLMKAVAETGLPVMVDVGAVIEGELDSQLDYLRSYGATDISLLYESHSPNPSEVNLLSIPYLKERYQIPVGYSSEGRDIKADLIALALGAEMIEKRIKPADGKDGHHRSKALDPDEFKAWVEGTREAESMLGKEGLFPSAADIEGKVKWFTSMVWDRDAKAGEVVTEDFIAARRPGAGLSPRYRYLLEGRRLTQDVKRNKYALPEAVE